MKNFEKDNLTGENHEGAKVNTPLRFLTASSVLKDTVCNLEGDKLGEIKDIMLDINEGKIEYVVLQSGGFLGIGEKLFAIPYRLLTIDTENHAFVLSQGDDILKNAPGFDKDHWPETNNHNFESYNSYWGSFMGGNTGAEPF